jgi:cation transport regulator ChaB
MPIFLHRSAITFHSMRRTSINRVFAAPAEDIRQGEIAHRTAWAAIKRSHVKDRDQWVSRESLG